MNLLRNAIFASMKRIIGVFSELGRRLEDFGESASSRAAIEKACRANGWFTPDEVCRSVAAICEHMLQREKLDAWLNRYPAPVRRPLNVLVVMAGNIPLVGFFDLLCVVAAGHRCLIKSSAKDRVLITYVVDQLLRIDQSLPVGFYEGTESIDAVIATGSDNAARYFRSHYAGIPSLLRGSRQSVAVLSGNETSGQLAALADDIWAYSGLGCRNVSLLFLPRGCEPSIEMPAVNDKYKNNYRQEMALCVMTGSPFRDLGAAIAVEQCAFPAALSRIAYAYYDSLEDVVTWLAEHDDELQCVVSECIVHSRRVDFGRAQTPGLTDYPDEKDVMSFLCAL